ncbi:MAG TPA: rRNA maturation RNase YbeY [Longimicrobiales bacterium]|nr:rRNA maturation RNase YbeY [Longimicrobiales bacterium]
MAILVHINAEGVGPLDPDVELLLERAAAAAFRAAGAADAELSITLLDDAGIAALNERYLGHEGPTDVISFALYDEGEPPLGDVYIGHAQALRQAEQNGVAEPEELARLAIHGTLHVLGEVHPEGDERLDSPMWRAQERILREVLER